LQVAAAEDFVAQGAWVPHLALAEATRVLASAYHRGHDLTMEVTRKAGHGPLGTFDQARGKIEGTYRL
jgi:hypothetical protein